MNCPVFAPHGIVASSQKLASEVGVELLRSGGSAVDAAIGVNAMLNLIEPFMCGLGGDLFAQVWDPGTHTLHGLNASGRAPRGQTLTQLKQKLGGAKSIPLSGVHAITVPGAVAGWEKLHARFGRLPLAQIFAPVIEHANAGVEIGPRTALWWQQCADGIAADTSLGVLADGFRATYLIDGAAPRAGARFSNPALAASYAALAEHGLADFYTGEMARALSDYLAACGCAIDSADLAGCEAEWVRPIVSAYRGYDVYELPPNGQGVTVLQMLNLLEHYPLADFGYGSADYWHLFIEAKKLAFEDRAHFFADPDFAEIPIAELASKEYAAERVALIGTVPNPHPVHGDPQLAHGDTTYLSVADNDGMMVSLIQSIYNGFGSSLVPPELGFALQCRGAGFSLRDDHANVYAPGKRPFHTIIPAFVLHHGEPLLSFGVMGADMQPQGQVQVLVNMIDFGMDAQAAGDAARLRHDGLNGPNVSRTSDAGVVWYEAGHDNEMIASLRQRGHDLRPAVHPIQHFMGGYQCVRREAQGWSAASESRLDGGATGY
jgi:gamma-glutamyltranspeptidase/glutathione hydrolase